MNQPQIENSAAIKNLSKWNFVYDESIKLRYILLSRCRLLTKKSKLMDDLASREIRFCSYIVSGSFLFGFESEYSQAFGFRGLTYEERSIVWFLNFNIKFCKSRMRK